MGKFTFKRPRIISKKFPELDSSIDGVTKSLNDLVFGYHEQVSRALSKKHWLMAFSSIALILVLGSFISMRGKADSSIFYPETCLGGWINPENAQGEQQTSSNGDESQFTKDNSAVLPANTNAEMYCGNFKGKFDVATKPTKIIVSLALTKGGNLLPEFTLESGLVAATSSTPNLENSSSTLIEASSTESGAVSATSSTEVASSTVGTAIATPGRAKEEGPSILEGVVKSVQDTVHDLFGGNDAIPTQTDTVVVPPPVAPEETSKPEPQPEVSVPAESPTSFAPLKNKFMSHFVDTVFAQEDTLPPPAAETQIVPPAPVEQEVAKEEVKNEEQQKAKEEVPQEIKKEATHAKEIKVSSSTQEELVLGVSSSTEGSSGTTTIDMLTTTASSSASTTLFTYATGTEVVATSTDDNQFQNNFLEVFYTFDGVTWMSLGELNEISMKYRTFEIPVTASTSWNDLRRLQIKVQAKKQHQDTPTVYLDGIKVEVLYEMEFERAHPDFSRDTILNDETIDGIRLVTIINNDTKAQEIWYMYLEDSTVTATSPLASSTLSLSTSTIGASTTLRSGSAIDSTLEPQSSSTPDVSLTTATTTLVIKPVIQKNIWFKFDAKSKGLSSQELVELIRKMDARELDPKEKDRLPDFTLDTIKQIKGTTLDAVVLQLEKQGMEELWIYNIATGTQQKIDMGTSTSISVDSPLGVKGGHLFWLSGDESQVVAYNLITKDIRKKGIPPYDASKGERGEVELEGIVWKVIVSAQGFTFYSKETGEVFSDDDSLVAEALRQKLELDTVLSIDKIRSLNLTIDGTEDTKRRNKTVELRKETATTEVGLPSNEE